MYHQIASGPVMVAYQRRRGLCSTTAESVCPSEDVCKFAARFANNEGQNCRFAPSAWAASPLRFILCHGLPSLITACLPRVVPCPKTKANAEASPGLQFRLPGGGKAWKDPAQPISKVCSYEICWRIFVESPILVVSRLKSASR